MASRFVSWVKGWFGTPKVQDEPKRKWNPSPKPEPQIQKIQTPVAAAPVVAPPRPDRQLSAVEILQAEPDLSAAELASQAGVTLSYARSLIRRQKLKQPSKRQERMPVKQAKTTVAPAAPAMPAPAPEPVSVRNQVLSLCAAGNASIAIAEQLELGEGEVDFIVKVNQLARAAAKKS